MYGLNFLKAYSGQRVERDGKVEPFVNEPLDEDEETEEIMKLFGIEVKADEWQPINPQLPQRWRVSDWTSRPIRFIDGKDVGSTVISLRGTSGQWLPVRLAEIGSVEMRVVNGELRREFVSVERVVSMVTSVYPWEQVESFAVALQENSFRLLPVRLQEENRLNDFGRMQQGAKDRTRDEMLILEEIAIAQDAETPTIVDGLLAKHDGGFDQLHSPVFGVVKSHRQTYLHTLGQQVLYQLAKGQRTPVFSVEPKEKNKTGVKFPIITWYVRLCGKEGSLPNDGLVRIEVARKWFEAQGYGNGRDEDSITAIGREFINQLSRTIYEYRCREDSYTRAAISLHPIVRAEQSLGALFTPNGALRNRFYRLTGL